MKDDRRFFILKRVFHYGLKHYKFKLLGLDASVLVRILRSEFSRIESRISGLICVWYTVWRYVERYPMRKRVPKIDNMVKPPV